MGFISHRSLLAVAAIFHLAVCLAILVARRFGVLASVFDSDGVARSFAYDAGIYLADVARLIDTVKQDGLAAWFSAPFPLHVKIYSVSFSFFSRLVGFNILAAEPLNLVCYVAILWIVIKTSEEVFGRRAGYLTAIVIALWPTWLLHSTQILKEPLYVAALLGFILVIARCLTRAFAVMEGLTSGVLAGSLLIFLWLIKPDSWELLLLVTAVALVLLALKSVKEKQIGKGNVAAAFLLISFLFGIPWLVPKTFTTKPHPFLTLSDSTSGPKISIAGTGGLAPAVKPPARSSAWLERLRERISWARYLYVNYPAGGSNIDAEVRLESWREIIVYLPRAIEIGFFAPFPNTWFASGAQVGRAGRMLAGFETLLMYVVYVFSAFALWRSRRNFAVWFLAVAAIACLIVLSIATPNVGALYRFRYPWWMLILIIGMNGVLELRGHVVRSGATSSKSELSSV